MSFSFDATAGSSQSTSKPRLAGNAIYNVKLESCAVQDIQGVKDPDKVYKVLKIRFSNDDGYYEHTVFEPKPEDFKRLDSEITNKNGNKEKIPQPSGVESMMLLFKHIIDAFVPEVAKQIDSGAKKLNAPSWDALREMVVKILTIGKDKTSDIKLVTDNKGEAKFPSFFCGLSKEGKPYVRNNFIGGKLAFTPYEITRMKNEQSADIKNTGAPKSEFDLAASTVTNDPGLDLDFDVDI